MNFLASGEYLFLIEKDIFYKLKVVMYFWTDKFFYVLVLERALLVHKTLNFNH